MRRLSWARFFLRSGDLELNIVRRVVREGFAREPEGGASTSPTEMEWTVPWADYTGRSEIWAVEGFGLVVES